MSVPKGKKKATPGSFKKGCVPKSPGRPSLTVDQKIIRDSTREDLFQWFNHFKNMTPHSISLLNMEEIPLIGNGILNSLLKFYENGDPKHIAYLLDHIIGKADQTINLANNEDRGLIINFNPVSPKDEC